MSKTISTEELKKKLDAPERDFVLVDAMKAASYEARHVPGAKHVAESPDFVADFEKDINASKDMEIIVYCSSDTCQASVRAAAALEAAGYTHVAHYKDGLAGWQNAGLSFESQ